MITIGDIATAYMDVYDSKILSTANTQYRNIVETLEGCLLIGSEEDYYNRGKVLIDDGEITVTLLSHDFLNILGSLTDIKDGEIVRYFSVISLWGARRPLCTRCTRSVPPPASLW